MRRRKRRYPYRSRKDMAAPDDRWKVKGVRLVVTSDEYGWSVSHEFYGDMADKGYRTRYGACMAARRAPLGTGARI